MNSGQFNKNTFSKQGFQIEVKGSEIDLVCGMEVDLDKKEFSAFYKGKEYFFCSDNCLKHFKSAPKQYIG